jgi:Methane oxygenase PmoA
MKTRLFLLLVVSAAAALAALAPLPAAQPVDVVIDTTTDFVADGALVGRYHTGSAVAKPYLWPLLGPGGVPLTRAWPMEKASPGGSADHPHQKSAWFCHGDVIPEGVELTAAEKNKNASGVDFWSEEKNHGVIVCTRLGESRTEKDHGELTTHNEWRTAKGRKVLDETRTVHFYDLGDHRLFVFDIDLHAGEAPLTFGDTKEGSFGIRINDAIREEIGPGKKKGTGTIENAEGKVGEADCWGYPSAWCDYSGPIDGKTVGLAIFTDPSNPYPSCWHSRGYGLMAANPFGREKSGFPAMKGRTDLVKVAKGDHLKFRFGILTHPGDAKEGKVAEYYDRFVKLKG